jgi:hypothetical protein
MGLTEANFVGAEGINKIQYKDAQGQEQEWTMDEVIAIVASARAKETSKDLIKENAKLFDEALATFSNSQRELLS